jgi:hypothetical protein
MELWLIGTREESARARRRRRVAEIADDILIEYHHATT